MNSRCPGCGAPFQQDAPEEPGYLPSSLTEIGAGTVCRRCFRLKHYGRTEGRHLTAAEAYAQIRKALAPADAVVLVTEIGDFEGSLPPPGLLPMDKPLIILLNKADLLPPKTPAREAAAWARARWLASGRGPAPKAVLPISAARGAGLAPVAERLRTHAGDRRVVAVLGATSVGKSTLMRRILADTGAASMPTVSRYHGTTQAATRWYVEDLDLTLYDTPGFVPGDRMGDHLCPACAAQLVQERALTGKLFGVSPGQALVMGGFAAFALRAEEPRTFLCYAGGGVVFHRTGEVKAEELLAEKPAWLLPWACADCRQDRPRRREEVLLAVNEDLVVAGLGWISLRGGPAVIRATVPEGVRIVRRPALFAPRGNHGKSARNSRNTR